MTNPSPDGVWHRVVADPGHNAGMTLRLVFRIGCACVVLLPAAGVAADLCAGVGSYALKPLIGGQPSDLCKTPAKAVLVVNTASRCGFTPQYDGLEALHRRYKDKGLQVIGIPANDFGAQETGSNGQIAEFCRINYGVSFTVTEKLGVPIGQDPLFRRLAAVSGQPPQWNFHKYLLTADGRVQSFESEVEPMSRRLLGAVDAALAAGR